MPYYHLNADKLILADCTVSENITIIEFSYYCYVVRPLSYGF